MKPYSHALGFIPMNQKLFDLPVWNVASGRARVLWIQMMLLCDDGGWVCDEINLRLFCRMAFGCDGEAISESIKELYAIGEIENQNDIIRIVRHKEYIQMFLDGSDYQFGEKKEM